LATDSKSTLRGLVFNVTMPQHSPERDRVTIDLVPLETGWAAYTSRTETPCGIMLDAIAEIQGDRSNLTGNR
jgi:hypothetical protein